MTDYPENCRRCDNAIRRGKARGLCSSCHETLRLAGRLDEYPTRKPDTQAAVRPLYEAGKQAAEIARELGITRNAAWCAIRAIRQKDANVTGYRYESPNGVAIWAKLTYSAPAVEPECADQYDLFVGWLGDVSPMRGRFPQTWAQPYIAAALAVCARCPMQAWCVNEVVRPRESKVTIIAGGALWHDGKPRWTLAQQEALEAAQDADRVDAVA